MPAAQQRPPLSEAAALRYAVQRLNRRLRKQVHDGLTATRASLLSTVDRHGEISMARLRELEQTSKSGLTRLVASLEADGYLSRATDPRDGRGYVVRLTDEGRAILAEASTHQDAYLLRQLDALNAVDRDRLRSAVTAIEHLLAARA